MRRKARGRGGGETFGSFKMPFSPFNRDMDLISRIFPCITQAPSKSWSEMAALATCFRFYQLCLADQRCSSSR